MSVYSEMFGSAPSNDVDVEIFDEKWRQKLASKRQERHSDVMN